MNQQQGDEKRGPNDRTRSSERHVYVLATLDTKGSEAAYVADLIAACGAIPRLVDVGCQCAPTVVPDVARDEVYAAAGHDAGALAAAGDRGRAIRAAAQGAAAWMRRAAERREVAGVLAIGGSAGTTIGTAAMRALSIGVPKVMASTLASGQVRHYVGDKDILMLNTVVDLSGLNRITRRVLAEAAFAVSGMVLFGARHAHGPTDDRRLVAATMFGVTTPCVEQARKLLESQGYEVLVFHATGNGGQAMESLIEEGLFAGVLDITTTELADELVGGVLSAGPDRLTAAARAGVPQVVSLGATDMVNFHAPESVPARFAGRTFYQHNPNVTLMRTTADECAAIGTEMGRKLSASAGPVAVYAPLAGVSAIDRAGQPFDNDAARRALVTALRTEAPSLELHELDCHINDAPFARAVVNRLVEMIEAEQAKPA